MSDTIDHVSSVATSSVYDAVVGQDLALRKLRALADSPAHAYLFVGPPGCGKDTAARAFAAVKLQGSEDATQRTADLVMRGIHVDVHHLIREGASISIEQAREELVNIAGLSAVEGSRRVVIVHDFHLLSEIAKSALLKTVEEPGEHLILVLLADDVPETLATIESRCVRLDFAAIADEVVADVLRSEGVATDVALSVASVAAGDLDRARILATDPECLARNALFASVPTRLDGTGSRALLVAGQLLAAVDAAVAPLEEKQAAELADLEERVKQMGERGSGRKALSDRHKREARRYRTDELKSGLRTLTLVYHDALRRASASTAHHQTEAYIKAVKRIRDASRALDFNANEKLLLENLLWSLPTL